MRCKDCKHILGFKIKTGLRVFYHYWADGEKLREKCSCGCKKPKFDR